MHSIYGCFLYDINKKIVFVETYIRIFNYWNNT